MEQRPSRRTDHAVEEEEQLAALIERSVGYVAGVWYLLPAHKRNKYLEARQSGKKFPINPLLLRNGVRDIGWLRPLAHLKGSDKILLSLVRQDYRIRVVLRTRVFGAGLR